MPFIDKKRPQVTPQALELYKARLAHVDFIKKQQWVVTNYAVLIYAAIVWIASNIIDPAPSLRRCLSGLIIVAGICAIGLLIRFQFDLRRARKNTDRASAYCFSQRQRKALKSENYKFPFLRGLEVLLALILVCAVGAAVAVVFILH
jgi:hypothetical protein